MGDIMTIEQSLQIKRMLEGNFLKVKELDDNLFVAMMADYEFLVMVEAVKNYIITNKFQPTIAALIEEYNKIKLFHKTEIVRQMRDAGCFKSSSEYQKALTFIERDIIPDWFRDMMIKFINQPKLSKDKQLLLGMVS